MAEGTRGSSWAYIELMRPKQWYKNLLLFVGLVFSKELGNLDLLVLSILGFLAFCALSGSVYTLNDIIDRERDRSHPSKSLRPIASGRVSVGSAAALSAVLLVAGLAVSLYIHWLFLLVALAYLAEGYSYSLYFKNIVIVDAITLAVGFVIRAYAGTVAVDVPVTPWLVICVFLLALFLAFGKRRHELSVLGDQAENHREILKHYTLHMVEDMMAVSTATLIMAYAMYTFLATTQYMMLTIPFAIFGLLRYTFLVHMADKGGEPEQIFKDLPSLINLVLWVIAVVLILYFAPDVRWSGGSS
jgi:4-hydroxybenzoate polyprenyltransferase